MYTCTCIPVDVHVHAHVYLYMLITVNTYMYVPSSTGTQSVLETRQCKATTCTPVEYPCLSGERRHLPCINFKDSARPAELPRWLSWYSICLERRRSRVGVPPEVSLLFLWEKKELSSGVFACICLVSITDYSCTRTPESNSCFPEKNKCFRCTINKLRTCTTP